MSLSRPTARRLAAIPALLALVLLAALLVLHLQEEQNGLLTSTRLETMRATLALDPNNAALKSAIREADLELREDYFTHRGRFLAAGWMIVIAVAASVALARRGWEPEIQNQPAAKPQEPPAEPVTPGFVAISGVAMAGLMLLGVLGVAGHRQVARSPALQSPAAPASTGPIIPASPAQWPGFRGPGGLGVAQGKDWPTTWSLATGKHIQWKSEVPAAGKSSPVVCGDRLFLGGGDMQRQCVMAFDRASGKLLWNQAAQGPAWPEDISILPNTGICASTPATDGKRVYAIFANARIVAFDLEGDQLWIRELGQPENTYGHAASLIAFADTVIVQFDQGSDEKDPKSALLALDGATGEVRWKTPRPVPSSWASPILIQAENKPQQLIACANPWVIAYDPATGAELWRAALLKGDVAPSPAFADGKLFVLASDAPLSALKVDGRGDVTTSAVLWTNTEMQPDIASPVAGEGFLLTAGPGGLVTCYAADSGQVRWTQELEGTCMSSPVLAGGRIYLTLDNGTTQIIDPAGTAFNPVGKGELGEKVFATPAFVESRIYLRTEQRLVCIGGAP